MSKEHQPTRLRASDATGHLGRLIGNTVLARLTDADGKPLANAGFEGSHKYKPSHVSSRVGVGA
jgi:hypothetical protein